MFTIAEAARRSGLSIHTIRYYDKEGLMPYVERSETGIRQFKESDFEWLSLINCLKESGMPIKKIKDYVDMAMDGDSTTEDRLLFMQEHKKDMEKQLEVLLGHLARIDQKIEIYAGKMAADAFKKAN